MTVAAKVRLIKLTNVLMRIGATTRNLRVNFAYDHESVPPVLMYRVECDRTHPVPGFPVRGVRLNMTKVHQILNSKSVYV